MKILGFILATISLVAVIWFGVLNHIANTKSDKQDLYNKIVLSRLDKLDYTTFYLNYDLRRIYDNGETGAQLRAYLQCFQ